MKVQWRFSSMAPGAQSVSAASQTRKLTSSVASWTTRTVHTAATQMFQKVQAQFWLTIWCVEGRRIIFMTVRSQLIQIPILHPHVISIDMIWSWNAIPMVCFFSLYLVMVTFLWIIEMTKQKTYRFLFLNFIRPFWNLLQQIWLKKISVRLVDADVENYGKLQVHNESGWYSVCDTNFDDVDARVACKTLGYKDGRAQLGSALGTWMSKMTFSIGITDVNCTGNEAMFRYCQMSQGKCQSGHYVTLACTRNNTDTYSKFVSEKYETFTKAL